MLDVRIVVERLEALKKYIAELDCYARYPLTELVSDFVKCRAAEHSLQLAAQAVIDIALCIVEADFGLRVQEYGAVIESLGEVGVLSVDFARRLAPLADLRNTLVSGYRAVDPVKLYAALTEEREDLREFGRLVAEYLRRRSFERGDSQ